MKSFDRIVTLILLLLAVLIAFFVLQGDQVGVQVSGFYPQPGEQLSAFGLIGIVFNQEMVKSSVEERLTIEPKNPGEFQWENNTLWFKPETTWQPEQTYSFTLQAGAVSKDGRTLLDEQTWQAVVRQPGIIYLVLEGNGGDLWRLDFETRTAWPLTQTNGSIIDFAVHPTGDSIVYSQTNPNGGMDLVIIDRDGNDFTALVLCEHDLCNQPAWSPDGVYLAYVREAYLLEKNRLESPRIWTLHIPTGETAPLYPAEDSFGHSPAFSPDGSQLATYDIDQEVMRILNLESSQEYLIPSGFPAAGDWSPDGQSMIYLDIFPTALEPFTGIYVAELVNQQITQAFGELIEGFDFSPPQWSPAGDWIAYSARPSGGGISKLLWVQKLGETDIIQITDDLSATYSAYQWDPWGDRLIFQRYGLGASDQHPSLWMWDWESGEINLLVETGARPQWLP